MAEIEDDAQAVAEALSEALDEGGYGYWINTTPDPNLAYAAIEALAKRGRLLPPGGEVKTQWAVRWHLVGGGVDEQDCYRNARETAEQRARRLAARPPMGVERGEALMRRIYTGPWSPVLSDNSEGESDAGD